MLGPIKYDDAILPVREIPLLTSDDLANVLYDIFGIWWLIQYKDATLPV